MTTNSSCEPVRQNEALVSVTSMKDGNAKGVQLEASGFERLLQRAAEILSLREQKAA